MVSFLREFREEHALPRRNGASKATLLSSRDLGTCSIQGELARPIRILRKNPRQVGMLLEFSSQ